MMRNQPKRLLLHMTREAALRCTEPEKHKDNADVGSYVRSDLYESLAEQVEDRTTLLAELFDYVGRLESSMSWAVATRGWYKFPEAGDLGARVKAALGKDL